MRLSMGGGSGIGLARAHVWRALAFATAWCAASTLQIAVFAPARVLDAYLSQNMPWEWASGLFLYGVLAGVGHAVGAGRLLRARDAAAARAELHALRAQLDPHFLFNTLHSLTALARRDPAAVERGLEQFGGLLRYVLEANRREQPSRDGAGAAEGDGDVPLGDELAFVRDYLALERLRLGERLRTVEEVDDEALECGIPALTLQPLVENAVRHGIAPRAAGGTLRLLARVDDDGFLVIEVGDDGPGCAPAEVDTATGVGIDVVRRRLRARYGVEGTLGVVTAPGQGFLVRMRVPGRPAPVRRPTRPPQPIGDLPRPAAGVPA
jgi:LytS/YehU family sensor histidine kinase